MSNIVDSLSDYIRAGFDPHNQLKEARGEIERLNAEIARLREALQKIANKNVPRPVKFRYRDDRSPSTHDRCTHHFAQWEDCPYCIIEYARAALAGEEKKP